MNVSRITTIISIFCFCLGIEGKLQAEAELLLRADFNQPGNMAEGMIVQPPKLSYPAYAMEISLDSLTPEGSGVTGKTEDRGYKNQTIIHEDALLGARARFFVEEKAARSFTISGWYFLPDDTPSKPGSARFLQTQGTDPLALFVTAEGGLNLSFNRSSAKSGPDFWTLGKWMFFAITFDGTKYESVEPNVRFYLGSLDSAPRLVGEETLLEPQKEWRGSKEIAIGNMPGKGRTKSRFNRPFPGILDNIQILISPDDASAALSAAALKDIWKEDRK